MHSFYVMESRCVYHQELTILKSFDSDNDFRKNHITKCLYEGYLSDVEVVYCGESFYLHRVFLASSSNWFARAFDPKWNSASHQVVRLDPPDIIPVTRNGFIIFVSIVYNRFFDYGTVFNHSPSSTIDDYMCAHGLSVYCGVTARIYQTSKVMVQRELRGELDDMIDLRKSYERLLYIWKFSTAYDLPETAVFVARKIALFIKNCDLPRIPHDLSDMVIRTGILTIDAPRNLEGHTTLPILYSGIKCRYHCSRGVEFSGSRTRIGELQNLICIRFDIPSNGFGNFDISNGECRSNMEEKATGIEVKTRLKTGGGEDSESVWHIKFGGFSGIDTHWGTVTPSYSISFSTDPWTLEEEVGCASGDLTPAWTSWKPPKINEGFPPLPCKNFSFEMDYKNFLRSVSIAFEFNPPPLIKEGRVKLGEEEVAKRQKRCF